MLTPEQIKARLLEALPSAQITVRDLTGGGDHWQVQIKAQEFSGKGLVEQHQMVYAALGEWMHREIHALALDTKEVI